MMEPIPVETGRVVTSRQGRDRGRSFVVLSAEGEFVLMADGLTRRLDHAKKKKLKHLKPRPVRMEDLEEALAAHRVQDSDIRRFLNANGFGIDQPLCKED